MNEVERSAIDAIAALAKLALGEMECPVCRGAGRAKLHPSMDRKERICERCHGSGKELLSPGQRANVALKLVSFASPGALIGPATSAALRLLNSDDPLAAETAKATAGRLERLAAKNRLPPAVEQAIFSAIAKVAKEGGTVRFTEISE